MSTPPAYGGPPPLPPIAPGPSAQPRRGPGRWIALGCAGLLGVALLCGLLTALGVALGRGRSTTPTVAANRAPTRTTVPTGGGATTATRAATPATPAPMVVHGCGGGTVQIGFDAQLRRDLDQWNRVVDAANPVTRAWNELLQVSNGIKTHREAAGNTQLVAVADNYLAVAQAHLPALRAETAGRFEMLATQEVAVIEAGMQWVTLLRTAAADSDQAAWNRAIDVSGEVDVAKGALDAELEEQCDFWRSRR